MQIGCKLCEFRTRALFLAFLLLASDVSIVFIKVATNFLIFGLNVLEVLLACVEIVLPTARIVSAIAKINK